MDNSLSKVNHISHLATKSVDDKKVNLLQKKHNKDLQEVFRYALGGKLNYNFKLIDFGRSKTFN